MRDEVKFGVHDVTTNFYPEAWDQDWVEVFDKNAPYTIPELCALNIPVRCKVVLLCSKQNKYRHTWFTYLLKEMIHRHIIPNRIHRKSFLSRWGHTWLNGDRDRSYTDDVEDDIQFDNTPTNSLIRGILYMANSLEWFRERNGYEFFPVKHTAKWPVMDHDYSTIYYCALAMCGGNQKLLDSAYCVLISNLLEYYERDLVIV